MYISSIDFFLPQCVSPLDLPLIFNGRRPNYSLALGWSCLEPDKTGAIDRVAVHRSLTERSVLGLPVLDQFSDPEEAADFCESLGFSGAYISVNDTASDMAEICVHEALKRHDRLDEAGFAAIIYAHTTPEEDPNLTPSFKIQTATGNYLSLPFSVSGTDAASFVSALQVAETVFSIGCDERPILVVAADRFLPPVHARIGDFTLFSDAASATVLDCKPSLGGYHLLGTLINSTLVGRFDWSSAMNFLDMEESIAVAITNTIDTLLRKLCMRPSDVAIVTSQHVNERMTRMILDQMPGLPGMAEANVNQGNFATSAILIALRQAQANRPVGTFFLGWCMGLDGTVAVALFEST